MAKAVANNVNPALATGTGPNGRIIERDIDKLIASGAAAAYAPPPLLPQLLSSKTSSGARSARRPPSP